MQWAEILELAATVDPASDPVPTIALLECSLGSRPGSSLVLAALGLDAMPIDPSDEVESGPISPGPFVNALDRAARQSAERWDDSTLAAVRVALATLSPLMVDFHYFLLNGVVPDVATATQRLASASAHQAQPDETGTIRCPRCRSSDVRTNYSSALGHRECEASCSACGLYESWREGDSLGAAWDTANESTTSDAAWVIVAGGRTRLGLSLDQIEGLARNSASAMRRAADAGAIDQDDVDRISGNIDVLRDKLAAAFPMFEVDVPGFAISAAPVTNRDYASFIEATGADEPQSWDIPGADEPDLPVLGVSWRDATAFAAWKNAALPTEAQWELAARGVEGRLFPWGNEYGEQGAWLDQQDLDDAWAPGEHPELATPEGCFDLVTGRWEWCSDAFVLPVGAKREALEALMGGCVAEGRVRRGGIGQYLIASAIGRDGADPEKPQLYTGFRLVRLGG